MGKSGILAFFILLILFPSFSQGRKLDNADAAYKAGEYDVAVDLYKDVYPEVQVDTLKQEILFKISECYRITNQARNAELWYRKAIRQEYPDPIVYFYYAEALKMNEEFDEALEQYQKYHELVPDDPKGEKGITSCNLARKWRENPTNYQVEEMKFFNSRESDFSPVFASGDYNTVYFTSNRDEATGEEIHGATGNDFSDIFVSSKDRRGRWSKPEPLAGENLNTPYEEGVCILNKDYNKMYFTRCQKDKKKRYGCQIFTSDREGDAWSEPTPLQIADDSIVVAHPALSPDERTLYFVSDMPGGYGGTDIWSVSLASSGDEVEPVNLGGDINTERDEMFPFVHPDGSLYFASNGHVGLGGLDIYKAEEQGSGWKVTNMRYPVNSAQDDFGIVFEEDVERGYFSSNRDGFKGTDDIYSFYLPPLKFKLMGTLYDKKSEETIPGASVKLIGSDGSNIEGDAQEDGSFTFMLRPNTDYVVISSREGYLKGKDKLTTKGLNESKEFEREIFMSPIDKPIDLPNIFFDYDRAELRPESKDALDKLIETLKDNPKITIELSAHSDITGTREYNYKLSQRRAQSVVDYLIEHGVDPERLTPKGYGPDKPKVIDKQLAREYEFLKEGDKLTPEFIENLEDEQLIQQAHQINRRTEFKVLSTDYEPDEQ